MGTTWRRGNLLALGLAGLWGASLGFFHWRGEASYLDWIEGPLIDLCFLIQGQRPAPDQVTIIAIDDETVQSIGAFPLPRTTVASLVETIANLQPKVIALDLLFVDPNQADGDQALVRALRMSPTVIAAAGLFHQSVQVIEPASGLLDQIPSADRLLLPLSQFAEASNVGTVNVTTDHSGTPRHVPLLLRTEDQLVPSFSLRAASIASALNPVIATDEIIFGDRTIATDIGYALPLRFYGPRGAVRTISAEDALTGRLDERTIRDRIVVIGATLTGGGDVFPTPFDPVLPGVEVLATAIAHLVEGDGLRRDQSVRLVDALAATALPLLLVLLLSWRRSALGLALTAGVLLISIGATAGAFVHGVWLSAALPLVAAAPPAILFGVVHLWLDRYRADQLAAERRTLARFQPPSLTDRLTRDPNFLADPVHQDAALIFIDLSGFTWLSELLGPRETRDMLKDFHALVDAVAMRYRGIVATFMGDGAMILFGLPEPGPDDSWHAVKACVDLCGRTQVWLRCLPEAISSNLGFKIGAHYGPIIASRLGGESYQHITAVGDTVNVASRLMEVASRHDADIALSNDLYRASRAANSVFNGGVLTGPLETSIRGRAGSINVWLWRRPRQGEGTK